MADAQITVGANADAATRAAAVVKSAWVEAGHAITSAMGQAAVQVVGSLASVATAQGKVNFSAQHQQVRDFEQATARLAVSMGRDMGEVRSSIEQTGVAIGKRPQEVAQWATEVGRLTYNFAGAVDAQKGLAGLAAQTGRQVGDYRGLAVELANVAKVGGDTTDVIGRLFAQQEQFKTAGGIAAFTDQVEGLSDMLSHMGDKSTESFLKVTALAGALGKGLDPQNAQRAQQQAFGAVTADPRRWELYLHKNLRDEHGQMKEGELPAIMEQIVAETKKRFGKNAKRVLMQDQNFGSLGGAQAYETDWGEVGAAAKAAAANKPANALAAYQKTDAGKREGAEAALSVSSRELMNSSTALGKAADALQRFASHNPFTSTLITTALTTGAAGFTASFGTSIATMMGGKGAGGAIGGGIGLLGKAAAPLAVGVAGAAAIYETYQASSQFFADQAHEQNQADARKSDLGADAALSGKVAMQRRANAAAKQVKGLSATEFGAGLNAMSAVVNKDAQMALGGDPAQAAMAERLKSSGMTADDAQKIAKAFATEMKNVKFNVTTRSDTPVEVAGAGANHPSAGNQGT